MYVSIWSTIWFYIAYHTCTEVSRVGIQNFRVEGRPSGKPRRNDDTRPGLKMMDGREGGFPVWALSCPCLDSYWPGLQHKHGT